MFRAGLIAILLFALLAAASCSGGSASARDAAFIPTASLDREHSMGADNANAMLVPVSSSGATLDLKVKGLEDAKAVYGQIDYDPSLVHLTDATANDGSSALSAGTLTDNNQIVMIVDEPEQGRVLFGMVLGNWPERAGIDGELKLATLNFAAGAASITRGVSVVGPPGNKNYNAIDLQATKDGAGKAVLTWLEALAGDGGNDGEVGLPDLTALGAKINSTSGDSASKDADYDKNGLPNISDLTALGSELRATLGGYKVMSAAAPGGPFTEAADIPRSVMFPTKPGPGEVTWTWTSPAPLTVSTSYKVVPYDSSAGHTVGLKESDVETLTAATPTVTSIDHIEFDDPNAVVVDVAGIHTILVTEESVDGTADNVDPFSLEHLQLRAIGELSDAPGVDADVTDFVLWHVTAGGGLADVTTGVGTRGDLTFHDRGAITVEAQLPGDFNANATIDFALATIETVTLDGPGASPHAASPGDSVQLTVTGLFDSDDNDASGNEYSMDITPYVNWAVLVDIGPEEKFTIANSGGTTTLETAGTLAGNQVRVSAEYPRTDIVLLNDNLKRTSPFYQVNIN